MKRLSLIGSSGSIGTQTLQTVKKYPEMFQVSSLVVHSNIDLLVAQIKEFKPCYAGVTDASKYYELKEKAGNLCGILPPDSALTDAITSDIDTAVIACSGINGLYPTLKAIEQDVNVALANKETLVTGGHIIMEALKNSRSKLFPIDSEHSAIWQSLHAGKRENVKKIILTASGGPFREYSHEQLKKVIPAQALKHPNWNMGAKITIDSATLMNKGLELIEAMYLFNLSADNIDILIHPESIIHSMVEYNDNAVIGQMSYPTMIIPIQYALTYPDRLDSGIKSLDFIKLKQMTFFEPDREKFPCLKIAEQTARTSGGALTIMNAANDWAVNAFLANKINFLDISNIIEDSLNNNYSSDIKTIEGIINLNNEVKKRLGSSYNNR